jgi:Domain of unknown function (DUF4277)
MGDGLDRAWQHTPATRMVTGGSAVNAMVRKGLGCVHQPRDLVPLFFQNQPTPRLIAPGGEAPPLQDDPRGRPLERLDADGVTALYRFMAATAAPRLGLAPPLAPLDRTRFPGDGRDHRAAAPAAEGMPRTRGDSREHRPDLTPVRRDLLGAHQAGRPLRLTPLSGHRRDVQDGGQVVTAPITPRQPTDGTTCLVAARAL